MRVFITGGAGYVGSHCVKDLCEHGHEVVVYDNLSMGHRAAVHPKARLIEGELGDTKRLAEAISSAKFDAAMHFAASVDVGLSVREPLAFYRNNVVNSLNLLDAIRDRGIRRLVFSSTCATYGTPAHIPITESTPQSPINPYGRSKLTVEWMLADSASAWGLFSATANNINDGTFQTASGTVVVLLKVGNWPGTTQVQFDDVYITPEPASLGLFGLAAIPFFFRRRSA